MASEKRFGCLGIALIIILCLSLLFNFIFLAAGAAGMSAAAGSVDFRESTITPGAEGSKIAVIRIDGVITGSGPGAVGDSMVEDIQLQLKHAVKDPEVKAILLAIDSPGGEVTASDRIYNAVRTARAAKPIVVSMGATAASGGYYIACGASHIVAHDTTFTGSIGVIMQALNYTDLMGKVGLQMVTFKSGKFKDMLSSSRHLTDEERDYVQKLVLQTYDKFVGIVATERQLPEAELRTGVADGRVVSGKDAFAAKLVDSLGDLDLAVAKARELGKSPNATVVRYELPISLGRYLRILGKAEAEAPRKIEVNVGPQNPFNLQPGKLYLLPSVLMP